MYTLLTRSSVVLHELIMSLVTSFLFLFFFLFPRHRSEIKFVYVFCIFAVAEQNLLKTQRKKEEEIKSGLQLAILNTDPAGTDADHSIAFTLD